MKLITPAEEIKNLKRDDRVTLACLFCDKHFTISKHNYQDCLNPNLPRNTQYCSKVCQSYHSGTISDTTCLNCQKTFVKKKSELKKSKNSFCSRSCSATYNNQFIPKRQKSKKCKNCFVLIFANFTFCSKECQKLYLIKNPRPKQSIEERKSNTSKVVVKYRQQIKIKAVNYKGGKCCRCGYNKCLSSLHLHHTDPTEKEFTISSKSYSWERIKEELNKCILLCANCHGEEHENLRNK